MELGSISRPRGRRWVVTADFALWSADCDSQLNAIPTIGYSGVLTSYITAVEWVIRGPELLKEGYVRVRPFWTSFADLVTYSISFLVSQ